MHFELSFLRVELFLDKKFLENVIEKLFIKEKFNANKNKSVQIMYAWCWISLGEGVETSGNRQIVILHCTLLSIQTEILSSHFRISIWTCVCCSELKMSSIWSSVWYCKNKTPEDKYPSWVQLFRFILTNKHENPN